MGEVVEIESGSSTGGRFKLYEQLELQEFQGKFVIKTLEFPTQGFSIDRHDGNIEPLDGKGLCFLCIWLLISIFSLRITKRGCFITGTC